MTAIEIAKHYIKLSNLSDFDNIQILFEKNCRYRSGLGELFHGVKDVMKMQRKYHASFLSLHWDVLSIKEIKPGVIEIEFNFKGKTVLGEIVEYYGMETLIFSKGKILQIEVKRK
jgi:hypothetical protein